MRKKRVAVFFGGRSGEHMVSLRSAASIMEVIDRDRYEIIPVGISRDGIWRTGSDAWLSLWENRAPREAVPATLLCRPGSPALLVQSAAGPDHWERVPVDLAFPILHGPYGEDGTIQGLFEMSGLPYVGSGVLASSTAMDKVVMKVLFRECDLPVGPFLYFSSQRWQKEKSKITEKVEKELGYPCFVKPANLGSSVGISKVSQEEDLAEAIEEALLYDHKVVIEALIKGREIECSVIGDSEVMASLPGEIIPCNEFYDYRAKYLDDRSTLIVPVDLGADLEAKIKDYACRAFRAVEGSGLSRVDFFVDRAGSSVVINEINTMPGFTNISMFPKLWEASGLPFHELVNRLLDLAMDRFESRKNLLAAPPE